MFTSIGHLKEESQDNLSTIEACNIFKSSKLFYFWFDFVSQSNIANWGSDLIFDDETILSIHFWRQIIQGVYIRIQRKLTYNLLSIHLFLHFIVLWTELETNSNLWFVVNLRKKSKSARESNYSPKFAPTHQSTKFGSKVHFLRHFQSSPPSVNT